MPRRTLLTVSGVIPANARDEVAAGMRPRLDYFEIADAAGADLMDLERARRVGGRVGRVVERLAGGPGLIAWACFRARREYDVILTDGEQVGLPLAALLRLRMGRRPRHAMIVHILTVRKKVLLFKAFGLGAKIDLYFVYAQRQAELIADVLGVPRDRLVLTTFMADTEFWRPEPLEAAGTICAAGLELRDYPTLIEAVRDLDLRCVIAAGSRWSKRADSSAGIDLPPNVEVCSLGYVELRALYAASEFVVMPLVETDFQAGVTTILEAMAMGKAVVCSRTRGQTDVLDDGETGIYVRPGDVAELRRAIVQLHVAPERAAEMGMRAREQAVATVDVRDYARRLSDALSRWDPPGAA